MLLTVYTPYSNFISCYSHFLFSCGFWWRAIFFPKAGSYIAFNFHISLVYFKLDLFFKFSLSLWHEHDQINDVYDLFSNGSTKTKIIIHVYIYIHVSTCTCVYTYVRVCTLYRVCVCAWFCFAAFWQNCVNLGCRHSSVLENL